MYAELSSGLVVDCLYGEMKLISLKPQHLCLRIPLLFMAQISVPFIFIFF